MKKWVLWTIVAALVLLVGYLVVTNYRQKNEAGAMDQEITGLNRLNDQLRQKLNVRDSLLLISDNNVKDLRYELAVSMMKAHNLAADYDELKNKYDGLTDSLANVTADSSYRFLVLEAYAFPGHLKYLFNEPQVKGIHLTYLEKGALEGINNNLIAQIDEKDYQLVVKDTLVYEQQTQITLLKESQTDLEAIIGNKDGIIQVKDKQIRKEKRKKTIWQIAGGAVIVVFAVLGVSGG